MLIDKEYLMKVKPRIVGVSVEDDGAYGRYVVLTLHRKDSDYCDHCNLTIDDLNELIQCSKKKVT